MFFVFVFVIRFEKPVFLSTLLATVRRLPCKHVFIDLGGKHNYVGMWPTGT